MPEISLTRGKVTLVDEIDYPELSRWCWQAFRSHIGNYYAIRNGIRRGDIREKSVKMSRFILGLETGDPRIADHINGDTLDNRRSNLRAITPSQSCMNRVMPAKSTGVVGIKRSKSGKKWEARINVGNKYIHLGTFNEFTDAVAVRQDALRQYHGEFARFS